jgi:P-type Ca2+ transporter type 2C
MAHQTKNWHALGVQEALETLQVDGQAGLTAAQAKHRLDEYGPNELTEKPPPTFLERLWNQLTDFVVIILLVAAIVSALLGDYIEAAAIMAIVVLNSAIGVIQESKAEEALAALKKMAAPDAQVIRDGHRITVPAHDLVPGDIVLLEAGSILPADVRLIQTMNLQIEEASLTGESVPVTKRADHTMPADAGIGDLHNMAFMSTTVTYGRAQGVVVTTGMQTEIGKIAEMIQSVEEEDTPLQKKLDQLGKTLGTLSLAACGLVFAVGILRPVMMGQGFPEWAEIQELFILAVSLAIAAVPEGLPAVVTICLALGMQEMVKRHALIRRLPSVETLGSTMVICSDKTGTLTQNQMTAVRIWADGKEFTVTGRGYGTIGEFESDGQRVDLAAYATLRNTLWGGVLCNDSALEQYGGESEYRMVGDPTEGAMVVAGAKAGYLRTQLEEHFPRVNEIPFDADRKRMTTVHTLNGHDSGGLSPITGEASGFGYIAVIKGAPDLVIERCTQLQTDSGPVPMSDEMRERVLQANAGMASQALRVLGVAYRPLSAVAEELKPDDVEHDLVFVGLQGIIDPARPEVLPAVQKAQGAGLRTIMVTGDYAATAAAIASEIGILRPGRETISGAELERMSDQELDARIDNVDVFARVSPNHKMRIVAALRKRGNVVAMTGDGVNDAPALKQADIGIAMGITGTDVTKQTADMVLTDDNYVSIVSAIEQGRVIYSNIRKFVYFLLSCNVAEIMILFLATIFGWPAPLTAIQLLWLNLLSDGAPALALGLEKGDPDIMNRPPRPPNEPVINREMTIGVGIQTVAITSAVLGAYWLGLNVFAAQRGLAPGSEAQLMVGQTMAFVTLVLSELFRAYTARSERYPLFRLGVFSNKFMQYAVGFSVALLLLVVYLPIEAINDIFNTVPVNLREWLWLTPLILLPSILAELQKVILFRRESSA